VVGALVLGPLALGYGFALARLYPMADRVALWLAPLFLVLICVPVDAATAALVRWWADRRASGRRPDLRAAVAAMVAAGTVAVLLAAFAAPVARGAAGTPLRRYARTEEALRFVARSAAPADKVYIHVHTVPAVLWYGDRVGLRWEGRFDLAAQPQDCPAQPLLAGVAESGELWLVLGLLGNDPVTLAMLHAELDRYGRSTGEWRYDGIVVVRYHRSETQPPPQPRPGCQLPGRRTYQG